MLSFKQFNFPPAALGAASTFEPSNSTKMFWLYTKKNQLNFGVTLPGLCETTGYSTQMLAFFGVLALEIIPTVYGISQGLLWQAVVAAIFVDIFLAIVAHIWHDKILLAKNQLVINQNMIAVQNLKRLISKYKLYTNFFYFLIFVSGCVKFFFFYIAYVFFDAISGAVLICYLLGALLHITYTGYFIYTSRFYWFINREYSQYLASGGTSFAVNIPIVRAIQVDGAIINFSAVTIGPHQIFNDTAGNYFFHTLGVMTDSMLVGFINAQPNTIASSIIAREGLSQQLANLGALPAAMGNAIPNVNPIQNNIPANLITGQEINTIGNNGLINPTNNN